MAKTFKNYKDESRKEWGAEVEAGEKLTRDQLSLGAQLRIADATELMAKNVQQMQWDLDREKKKNKEQHDCIVRLLNQQKAYKGVITKLKNKL